MLRLTALALTGVLAVSLAAVCEAGDRPHVLLILADDLGFSDIGCYGSEIETPNLDSLAFQGKRLTSWYSGYAVCSVRRLRAAAARGLAWQH